MGFSIDYEDNFSRKTQEFLSKVAYDPSVLSQINTIIGTNLNQFVPMQSGALRQSMHGEADGVHWSTPYAHYQYMGRIYEVNKPLYYRGQIVGWKSPTGEPKTDSGRELGVPRFIDGWTFGYTTPGTKHHWDEAYTGGQWQQGSGGLKAKINLEITKYVKRIANMFFAFNRG